MSLDRDPLITVSRDPRDHRRARVRLSALDAFAFDTFTAGTRSKIPRPMIAASVALGDVAAIRARTGLSQAAFSARIGVALPTLRNWEQGRRAPEGPARVLLAMLDRNPHVVEQTLGTAA